MSDVFVSFVLIFWVFIKRLLQCFLKLKYTGVVLCQDLRTIYYGRLLRIIQCYFVFWVYYVMIYYVNYHMFQNKMSLCYISGCKAICKVKGSGVNAGRAPNTSLLSKTLWWSQKRNLQASSVAKRWLGRIFVSRWKKVQSP